MEREGLHLRITMIPPRAPDHPGMGFDLLSALPPDQVATGPLFIVLDKISSKFLVEFTQTLGAHGNCS